MNLNEACIIVTGGANGFGKELAVSLKGRCEIVYVIDRDQPALEKLGKENPELSCHQCDLTHAGKVKELMASLFETDHPPNVLINNAGVIYSAPLINMLNREDMVHSSEKWKEMIDVNLNSVFYAGSNFAGEMVKKRRKGLVLNISSVSAAGNVGQSAYSAAKSGVEALTKTWAKELSPIGIRSACIAPGFFDTSSTHKSLSEAHIKKWTQQVPLKRLGKASELVSAVEFVISNDYYNGKILELDGGLIL